MVVFCGSKGKRCDRSERLSRRDIDCGKTGREMGPCRQEREVEDQKDQAVLAAIVAQGEGGET